MPADVLKKIMEHKARELVQSKQLLPLRELERLALATPAPVGRFHKALQRTKEQPMRIIAEVKKASPSKGVIDSHFDPLRTALNYIENGVDAISVLTEREFFQGNPEYLRAISCRTEIPCLRKDFLLEEYQVLEARLWGASACLLIASCLPGQSLRRLVDFAQQAELDVLVEVHDETETFAALEAGASLIGVNNRNLHTFEVDLHTTIRLRPLIPENIPLVAESGISQRKEVQLLEQHGVSAILVGEAFMRGGSSIKELRG